MRRDHEVNLPMKPLLSNQSNSKVCTPRLDDGSYPRHIVYPNPPRMPVNQILIDDFKYSSSSFGPTQQDLP